MTERCLLFCCQPLYGRHKTEYEGIPPMQVDMSRTKLGKEARARIGDPLGKDWIKLGV
jgi:hypothetical protein